MTIAPVSVATSTSRSAPWSIAWARQSASTSRPSASVLITSIVVPVLARRMSPGFSAWPLGRFSVAPITLTSRTGRPSRGDRAGRLEHRGAARHVELHLAHLRAGLDRDAAGVERHALADEAEHRAGDVGGLVADRDQLRLLVAAAGDAGERAHAGRLDLGRGPRPRPARRRSARRALGQRASGVISLAGRVLQVARGVRGLGDDRGALDVGARVVVRGDDQLARCRGSSSSPGLVGAVLVGGQQRALDEARRARRGAGSPSTARACRAPSRGPATAAAATRARSASNSSRLPSPASDVAPAAGVGDRDLAQARSWPRRSRRAPAARRRRRGRSPRPRTPRRRSCRPPCRAAPAWWNSRA